MNKFASKTFFFILSTSLILSSCGGGNSKRSTGFDPLAKISTEKILSNDELGIATRICYAYKDKSQRFRTPTENFYGTQFIFKVNKTDCQNMASTYNVATIMKYDDKNVLMYIPQAGFDPNLKFNKKVQTDRSGYLAQVCPKVFTNQPLNNTTTDGDVKVQIVFFSENGMDGYMLNYFTLQADNTYKLESGERLKIVTAVTPAPGQIRGMDQFYSTQKICANALDKVKYSNLEQNFISR
ncbi:MAG: hypothetical protein WC635_14320 [Bacteriovorax sp.]|jgi:hypothetical protein